MLRRNGLEETLSISTRTMKQHKNHADNLPLQQEIFHQNLPCSRRLIFLILKVFKSLHITYFLLALLIHYKTTSVILETSHS